MSGLRWRDPSVHERALLVQWLETWNAHTGDAAEFPPDGQVADSCGCGTCPTFIARPISLRVPEDHEGPLEIEGNLFNAESEACAMILVFATSAGLELEFAPNDEGQVTLQGTSASYFLAR